MVFCSILNGRVVDDFIKKMTLYRLRSAIAIDLLEDQVGHSFEPQETGVQDPRSELLGWRLYGPADDWLRDPDHGISDGPFRRSRNSAGWHGF